MAGEIDEMSSELGGLRSEVKNLNNKADRLFDKFDKVMEKVLEQQGVMNLHSQAHHQLVAEVGKLQKSVDEELRPTVKEVPTIKATVEEHALAVEDFKTLKNRGIGIVAALGVAVSVIGAFLDNAWSWFTSVIQNTPPVPPH